MCNTHCACVRVCACALALPLIANGSCASPPPFLHLLFLLLLFHWLCTAHACIALLCVCVYVYFQMPWEFHFPLFHKSNFPNCLQPNCQRIIHSRLIGNAQRETERERQKAAETNDNVEGSRYACMLNWQIPCKQSTVLIKLLKCYNYYGIIWALQIWFNSSGNHCKI